MDRYIRVLVGPCRGRVGIVERELSYRIDGIQQPNGVFSIDFVPGPNNRGAFFTRKSFEYITEAEYFKETLRGS